MTRNGLDEHTERLARLVTIAEQLATLALEVRELKLALEAEPVATSQSVSTPSFSGPDLLEEKDAAAYFGCTPRTLRRRRTEEKLDLVLRCLAPESGSRYVRYSRKRIEAALSRSGRLPSIGR